MKTYLLATAVAMIIAATAQARIGWNLEQCRANYGHEVKVEKAWCGGTGYGFINQGLYIYVIFSPDGKVGDIIYFDNTAAKPLSKAMQEYLWTENAEYYIALNGWDGKQELKKLGQEHFHHWVVTERNGLRVLVENANKNGWQIRNMRQFQIEQSALKAYPSTK